MKKSLLKVLAVLLLIYSQAYAQNRTVTGRVTAADDNLALPGVSVRVKGTSSGTTTGADGTFSISARPGVQLTFTSVGYLTQEVTVPANGVMDVKMTSDSKQLSEVVVVGYGTGKTVSTATASVSTVGARVINEKPVANAIDALQGKVPGLQVYTSSGEPSQSSSIRLHGVGSLGASSTPLYVMDGIQVDQGTVVSLNPNDIENISVLKDASATSIYGARAANGVIYITTKTGSVNKPAEINIRSQYGVSAIANDDFFKQFMGGQQLLDFQLATGQKTAAQIAADATLNTYGVQNYQWYKSFYKDNTPTYQTDLSVSGGGGKTTYFVSGAYFNQDGLAYRSDFDRATFRSNVASSVNNWMKFGVNLSMGNDNRMTNSYGSNNLNRGLALLNPSYYSPYNSITGEEFTEAIPGLGGRYNPKYLEAKIYSKSNNAQFNPSGYLQINPYKGLTIKSVAGMDAYDYRTSSGTLPSYGNLYAGTATESFSRGVSKTFTNTIEYKFTVKGEHNFTALAGHEYVDNTTTALSGSTGSLTDDRLITLSSSNAGKGATGSKSEYSYLSFFGRLEYGLKNKYFLEGTVRNDASSRFGSQHQNAVFWSAAVKWNIKKESFLQDVNWLDDLSVKFSTGTQGNSQIGNYQSLATVTSSTYNGATGFILNAAGNPDLQWETQRKTTIGVQGTMFDRVNLDVQVYNRTTSDMLISVPFPLTSGYSSITSNVGSLNNKGIDVDFRVDVLKSKSAYLTPYVSFNYNKEKVTELFQGKNYWNIAGTGVTWVVGKPVSFFYPIFKGVNPTTGLPEWYNPNKNTDETVVNHQDPNDITTSFNSNLQQNTNIRRYAPFNGGFGVDGGYKGFYVEAYFSFSQGKYMINNDRYFYENPNQFSGYNQSNRVLDYWKNPGDVTLFPKYGVQFTQFDSRLIENASFLRLKTMTLGWTVPTKYMNYTKVIKGAKIYLAGRNILTWTKYLGPDPEVDSNLGLGTNPNTKQYTVGLDLKF